MKFFRFLAFYFIFLFLTVCSVSAQYYFNDIMNTNKLNREYALLKTSGNQKIVLESFEDDDSPSEGFFCETLFTPDFKSSKMISKSNITGESELRTFYDEGRIVKAVTATPGSVNTVLYRYDGDKLHSVEEIAADADSQAVFTEQRIYEYDQSGVVSKMRRMRNGGQVSVVSFVTDERGNVVEEVPSVEQTGRKYYYYYNDKDQLTDIVRFHAIAQKLLPDFMFVYNDLNQLSQMISVDESGRNYFIWRYSYTAQGLPEIQKCYSKEKRLLGTIQFEYLKRSQ